MLAGRYAGNALGFVIEEVARLAGGTTEIDIALGTSRGAFFALINTWIVPLRTLNYTRTVSQQKNIDLTPLTLAITLSSTNFTGFMAL